MCNKRIVWPEISEQLRIPQNKLFDCIEFDQNRLNEFQEEGILTFNPEMICMEENGLPFLRNVAASFDPLMAKTKKLFQRPFSTRI